MKLVLKAFNQMQKTVGMRLNNKRYAITVLYVTFFQMQYYLMQHNHKTIICQNTSKEGSCWLWFSKTSYF